MWIRPGQLDLTYCTNIHAGEGWDEVKASIARYALPLKQELEPNAPFGIGLRLSAVAATQLLSGNHLSTFKEFLDDNGLYVALINGFPYGSFHGGPVKSQVFAPDWRDQARVRYTLELAEILSVLLPEGMEGGISTMPLSYKPWLAGEAKGAWADIVANLSQVVDALVEIRKTTGRLIHIDIEPEPNGLVESTAELIEFFEGPLKKAAATTLAERLGCSIEEARSHLLVHVQACFDTCHMAVEFEDSLDSLRLMAGHGIRIGRIQISSALRVVFDGTPGCDEKMASQLAAFVDTVYLHQVIERRSDGSLTRYADLDEALAASQTGPKEWRIHFHVPIFTGGYGALSSTQAENEHVLAAVTNGSITPHLEIETYTWDVLPAPLKSDLGSSIAREYRWVLEQLCTRQ